MQTAPVKPEKREANMALELFPEQSGFIESVEECLAEAEELSLWRPVGIYDGVTLVGFAMYGLFPQPLPDGQLWLDRLLIDKNHQGAGYGKTAVAKLLKRLHSEYGNRRVYLSVYDTNRAAIALYQQLGFSFTGELDTKGEKIMAYDSFFSKD